MSPQPYFDGPPRFDVGLSPIALSDWLMPDDQAHWLGPKNDLINTQTDAVFVQQLVSRPAQEEAARLIGLECRQTLRANQPPLLAAARLVSDDLVIMENRDGQWTNTACCLCSPTFFSAPHAIGKTLTALHGPVPDGQFGLAKRIGRVFSNLGDDTILQRHNWTVQWGDARYTPDATSLRQHAETAQVSRGGDHLFLRVERQTIRRLPKTGAILFTIRIRLTALAEILVHHDHRGAFQQAWSDTPEAVRHYKQWAVLERHVAGALMGAKIQG